MKPNNVTKNNEKYLLRQVYATLKSGETKQEKCKNDDYGGIRKYREAFLQRYQSNWGNEIFQMYRIKNNPIRYVLKHSDSNVVKRTFLSEKLETVKHPNVILPRKFYETKEINCWLSGWVWIKNIFVFFCLLHTDAWKLLF